MKKIVIVALISFFLVGCGSDKNISNSIDSVDIFGESTSTTSIEQNNYKDAIIENSSNEMLEDTIGEQSVVAEQDTIANNSKVQIKNFFPDGTFWAIETKESGEEYIIHANILGNVIKRLFSSEIGELEYGINDTLIIVRSKGEYDKFHVLDVQTNEDITNRYVGDYDEICKYIETEDKVVFVVKKIVKSFEEKYVCLQLVDEIGNKIFQTSLDKSMDPSMVSREY